MLADQFHDNIPAYELDQKSQDILSYALKKHMEMKNAKLRLLESLDQKIADIQMDIASQ